MSSDTASSFKNVYEDRVHEFKRTQGETERKLKLLNKIFAFITIEITKFIRSVLPGTDHLLSNEHFCVHALPAFASKSVFLSKGGPQIDFLHTQKSSIFL
jgi:hypothetical protein